MFAYRRLTLGAVALALLLSPSTSSAVSKTAFKKREVTASRIVPTDTHRNIATLMVEQGLIRRMDGKKVSAKGQNAIAGRWAYRLARFTTIAPEIFGKHVPPTLPMVFRRLIGDSSSKDFASTPKGLVLNLLRFVDRANVMALNIDANRNTLAPSQVKRMVRKLEKHHKIALTVAKQLDPSVEEAKYQGRVDLNVKKIRDNKYQVGGKLSAIKPVSELVKAGNLLASRVLDGLFYEISNQPAVRLVK